MSRLFTRGLLATALLLGLAGPAAADGSALFSDLPAMDSSLLGGVSVGHSLLNLNGIDNKASVDHTSIDAGEGEINTGWVAGNIIANNRGITSVLANSGNNVSVNNATILNIFIQ